MIFGKALVLHSSQSAEEPATFTLTYQVVKSLDPNVYRNVEFDVWHFTRRGMSTVMTREGYSGVCPPIALLVTDCG